MFFSWKLRRNLLSHFFNVLGNVKEKNFINRITKKNLKKLGKSLINSTYFDPITGKVSFNSSFKLESNVINDKTLIELKKDISDDFQRLNNKVIIVIDDIDRLTNIEIQQIFMLVKSLADFPNVIYLLSGGGPDNPKLLTSAGSAGDTDLLITWLFKITTGAESKYYLASVIGIMIFVFVSTLALVVYNVIPSTRNEEDYS